MAGGKSILDRENALCCPHWHEAGWWMKRLKIKRRGPHYEEYRCQLGILTLVRQMGGAIEDFKGPSEMLRDNLESPFLQEQ